jgi:hypothetical protein
VYYSAVGNNSGAKDWLSPLHTMQESIEELSSVRDQALIRHYFASDIEGKRLLRTSGLASSKINGSTTSSE